VKLLNRTHIGTLTAVLACAAFAAGPALAQEPEHFPPGELDRIVSRIALYPDPLLAQVLSAATFPEDLGDAAKWADQHHYLSGDRLANAINEDRLPWDPSVQALLPFPNVLEMMAADMGWTNQLCNAVLVQRPEVMDAVQRMRRQARDFGYLRSGGAVVVAGGPYITIMPARPDYIVVPVYDPLIVFAAPRRGFVVGTAINFGFGISVGAAFRPWGWGVARFDWGSHGWFIGEHPWGRTWATRVEYRHPYTVQRYEPARRVEGHELITRSPHEREVVTRGGRVVEEHRKK
jgi:Protein of unknown function (DUF3300)